VENKLSFEIPVSRLFLFPKNIKQIFIAPNLRSSFYFKEKERGDKEKTSAHPDPGGPGAQRSC